MKLEVYVIIFGLTSFIAGCNGNIPEPSKSFSKEDWSSSAAKVRYIYAQDLIRRKILLGMKEKEVTGLLGHPNSTSNHPTSLQYLIKIGGNGFDQVEILDIRFEEGKVARVFIRGD